MKNKIILFFVIMTLTVSSVFAQEKSEVTVSLEQAVASYSNGDYVLCRKYLNTAISLNQSQEVVLFKEIYEAKLQLDENPYSTSAANQVLARLSDFSSEITSSSVKGISDSYYALVMQCNAILGLWDEVLDAYGLIKKTDEYCVYLASLAYYINGKYNEAEQLLVQRLYASGKGSFENTDTAILYANVLGWQKKYTSAKEIYEKYYLLNLLDSVQIMDYAKVLYNNAEFEKACVVAKDSREKIVPYFRGICYLNLSDWKNADSCFTSYLGGAGAKGEYTEICSFYKAYTQYKMAKYKEAYNSFSSFASSTTNLSLARQSYELAARAAVFTGDFSKAGKQAENLVRVCFNDDEKHNAVIFCAQIYADCQNFDLAIKILSPYTKEKGDFALYCLYTMGSIYEKAGEYSKADEIYSQIINSYPNSSTAEDASYKRGQLYYVTNDYSIAASRFSEYTGKYNGGKYLEEVYYLCGECYLRCKEYDRSIMYSKNLVTKYPSSVYLYGANKNLFLAYYESGNYGQAQNTAKFLMNNFNSQVVQDGIPYQLKVLNIVSEGKNKEIAEKTAEYEKLGGVNTVNGRLCGYELFNLYLKYLEDDSALTIAKTLYSASVKKGSEEAYGQGQIISYIAKNSKGSERPALYIEAAGYYRNAGNQEGAASALYAAVEAFVELNQYGDGRETASTLKKLYPDSKQAKNVDLLLK